MEDIRNIENKIEYVSDDIVIDTGDVELSDEELENVSGGGIGVGSSITLDNAPLYMESYGTGYCGRISGTYTVQRIISGRKAPFLLCCNVGWVKNDEHVVGYTGSDLKKSLELEKILYS